jgi:hypothetical protein
VPRKTTKHNPAAAEIDPGFRSAGDAFANHRDVIGGKMMSFYGLKVNGNTFAMFGRKNISSPNFLDPTSMPFVKEGVGKNFDPG